MIGTLKEGARVRVDRYIKGHYRGSYIGIVKGFAKNGTVKVLNEQRLTTKCVSPDNCRVI